MFSKNRSPASIELTVGRSIRPTSTITIKPSCSTRLVKQLPRDFVMLKFRHRQVADPSTLGSFFVWNLSHVNQRKQCQQCYGQPKVGEVLGNDNNVGDRSTAMQ